MAFLFSSNIPHITNVKNINKKIPTKKGLEEGLKKGREEALNIFQTAIDMKKQGIDNQLIAEKTGLPLSLIESLK